MQEPRPKRQRSCISCGKVSDKVSLYRVVRTKDGAVAFDATGRVAGRGAYVCSPACLQTALAGKKLQRALKANVEKDDAKLIAEQIAATADAASKR